MLTRGLSSDTDLKWVPNREPDPAGYEVVWRETTEPVWTRSIGGGNVTSYTAKGMSRDNFLFGGRAVDRQGNKSPVAHLRPFR